GMMAGVLPGTAFRSHTAELRAGDVYVFYTDGISEAFNTAGEQFGDRRLLAHLDRAPGATPTETVAGLLEAVRAHAGDYPQSDDITNLAVRYAPQAGRA